MNTKHFALVTGSSSGIGKAIAEELAKVHINLLLVALPASGLPELALRLAAHYKIQVKFLEIDLTQPSAASYILHWCRLENYAVNILVNNAGFGSLGSFEKTHPEMINSMMILNNQVLVALTHAFIPEIRRHAKGYILNVGSLASFLPIPNKSVYAATKSFVYSFSTSLRLELEPFGIHVCCLCPGGTITSIDAIKRMDALHISRGPFHQMPEGVAKEAVAKMFQKKKRIIPGWANKMIFSLCLVLPGMVVTYVLKRIFSKQSEPKPLEKNIKLSPISAVATMGR